MQQNLNKGLYLSSIQLSSKYLGSNHLNAKVPRLIP